MNASHILRRAALLTATVGLAGTALVGAGGTAYAAPGPDHHGRGHHNNDNWQRNDGDNRRGDDTNRGFFEPRHPRQARHWDDDLERCNPSSCWRGFGGHTRGDEDHHTHGHGGGHGHGADD
jgi:hypothetical protein